MLPMVEGFCQLVLSELHDSKLGGHLDAACTLATLAQRVWWPRMVSNAEAYMAGCATCQWFKDRTQRKPGLLQPLDPPTERFHSYTTDFM